MVVNSAQFSHKFAVNRLAFYSQVYLVDHSAYDDSVTSTTVILLSIDLYFRLFVAVYSSLTGSCSLQQNSLPSQSLVLSNSSRSKSTAGEMVNLMAVDCQKLVEVSSNFSLVWSAPLQIIVALIFLFRTLGVSVLSGLAVMIIMTPMNVVSGKLGEKFQVRTCLPTVVRIYGLIYFYST